jgi:integrase
VALFITHLLDSNCSDNIVNSSVCAIKWFHDINGFPDPTNNCFVKNMIEAAKRIAHTPVKKKDPVSRDMLIELCLKHRESTDLIVVRDLAMAVLSFAGFLRYDEVSSLKCKDVTFKDTHLELFISHSKTDQYRQGNTVTISKGETTACPYTLLQKYISHF